MQPYDYFAIKILPFVSLTNFLYEVDLSWHGLFEIWVFHEFQVFSWNDRCQPCVNEETYNLLETDNLALNRNTV